MASKMTHDEGQKVLVQGGQDIEQIRDRVSSLPESRLRSVLLTELEKFEALYCYSVAQLSD